MSYIRGKYANASCDLIDYLSTLEVVASVGYRDRNRNNTLIVEIRSGDPARVPAEWQGFKTEVRREENRD